jgi:hypothetical protein
VRIIPRELTAELLGVRVDQQLVGVEAMAVIRFIRAVHAVAVKLARRDVRQIDVPHVVGALRQHDALDLALAFAIEQAQFDFRRIGGEQSEIGAAAVPRCPQGVRGAGGGFTVRAQE